MKMESLFFKYFFFPFLISITIITFLVTILLGFFTNNYYDKTSIQEIIKLEKKYAESELKSANIRVTSLVSKYQVNINELILLYQNIAKDFLKNTKKYKLETDYIMSAVSVGLFFCSFGKNFTLTNAVWVLDETSTNNNIARNNKVAQRQLIAFSHLIINLDAIFQLSIPRTYTYFFYFEKTELYITFPLYEQCVTDNIHSLYAHPYFNDNTCVKENGDFYSTYKVKCENFYRNMMKSKTKTFDNNYKSNQNRTIFLNNFFFTIISEVDQKFVMCIEFNDPISKGKGYGCVNATYNDLIEPLDNINTNINGYFFISNIGFNNVFYYPYSNTSGKIPTEYLYNLDTTFTMDEKSDFYYNIKKTFTSNYIDYIGDREFEEVFVNGKNSSEQYFYVNEELFNYSIYPIVLSNIEGKKEHTFSIIYVYNDRMLLESQNEFNISLIGRIIIGILLFLIFGFGLLYIIYLTFNNLSKNIHLIIFLKILLFLLKMLIIC